MPSPPLVVVPPTRWWIGFVAIGVFAVFMTGVAYLDHLPACFRVDGFDKVMHFGTAGMLAFFLDGALKRRSFSFSQRVSVPLAALLVLVPVGLEEFAQRYAVTRTSSVWDFAADVAGVAVLIPLSRRAAA